MKTVLIALLCLVIVGLPAEGFAEECGDVNGDGIFNLLDIDYLIDYLFRSGPPPNCSPGTVPVFTSTPITTVPCDEPYYYDADADGVPEPTYTLLVFPVGMIIDDITGLIEWMPNDLGYFDVVVEAANSAGVATQSFTIEVTAYGSVTDIDGNVYQTIKIGNQWWMTENLKVTHYSNGEPINRVTNNSEWNSLSTAAYCEYLNDYDSAAVYGNLYNWFAVYDSRNIAPEGWHVPSDAEWMELEVYLGMSQTTAEHQGFRGDDEGGKLKEAGTLHWAYPNTGATNVSGFTALPGGARGNDGWFEAVDTLGIFWTATQSPWEPGFGVHRYMRYDYAQINRGDHPKRYGFSVRCVKD